MDRFAVFYWEDREQRGGWDDFRSAHGSVRSAELIVRDVLGAEDRAKRCGRHAPSMSAQIVDLWTRKVIFDSEETSARAPRLEVRTLVPDGEWKLFATGPASLASEDESTVWDWFAAHCPTSHFDAKTESRVTSLMDTDDRQYQVRTGPFFSSK